MTARRSATLVVVTLLSVFIAWPVVALAAGAPTKLVMQPPTEVKVTGDRPETVMMLGATLTTEDGKPVANQRIEFLMATDILGQTEASLGKVFTDSNGLASTSFVVTRSSSYEFAARFTGTSAYAASKAPAIKAEFVASAATAAPHEEPRLSLIGRWVPWIGLGLTIAVWLVLTYVMATVLIVVPRAAHRAPRD